MTGAALLPRAVPAAPYQPLRIDVHHHVLPPAYNDFVAKGLQKFRSPIDLSWWTVERAIADMHKYGIATAIVSWPDLNGNMPGDFGDVVRSCNERCAQLGRDHPGRFGSFATLPFPDIDASLKEIAYALDTLGADGMRAAPSYNGKYPGHPDFQPVWQELDRRKAIVFVHPTQPLCCGPILPNTASAILEFPFDTTRAIIDILLTGTFSKFPNIRWIFSHGGGTVPMLAGRIASVTRFNPKFAERLPNGVIYGVKKALCRHGERVFPLFLGRYYAGPGPRTHPFRHR
jgi:predicted TIM-barrel fold metal-dependent hydrolase